MGLGFLRASTIILAAAEFFASFSRISFAQALAGSRHAIHHDQDAQVVKFAAAADVNPRPSTEVLLDLQDFRASRIPIICFDCRFSRIPVILPAAKHAGKQIIISLLLPVGKSS